MLSFLAFLIACFGLVLAFFPLILPRFGVSWSFYFKEWRAGTGALAVLFLIFGFLLESVSVPFIVLTIFVLALFSIFRPHTAIRALSLPLKEPADSQIPEEDFVMGITMKDFSCAYPMKQMVIPRHIVNDKIADEPLVITYCAACRSGIAYKAFVNNRSFIFEAAGMHRRNLTLRDQQTRSIWQQDTGICLYGPLKGARLEFFPSEQMTWKAWKEEHPQTVIAVEPVNAPKSIFSNDIMYRLFIKATDGIKWVSRFLHYDRRLAANAMVAAVQINGIVKAYPLEILEKEGMIKDMIGNTSMTVSFDKNTRAMTAQENDTGISIPVFLEWWHGWSEFHPNTEIYKNA